MSRFCGEAQLRCQRYPDYLASDEKTSDWSMGLKFVQFYKKHKLAHRDWSVCIPSLVGVTPRIGLTSSNLHPDILNKLVAEDDLLSVFDRTGECKTRLK